MVLVQEDDDGAEHVIYYLSKSLSGPELCYSHVEKLALASGHCCPNISDTTSYFALPWSLLTRTPCTTS
jgi:hypothetical protein